MFAEFFRIGILAHFLGPAPVALQRIAAAKLAAGDGCAVEPNLDAVACRVEPFLKGDGPLWRAPFGTVRPRLFCRRGTARYDGYGAQPEKAAAQRRSARVGRALDEEIGDVKSLEKPLHAIVRPQNADLAALRLKPLMKVNQGADPAAFMSIASDISIVISRASSASFSSVDFAFLAKASSNRPVTLISAVIILPGLS